jgi:hypothetical protein
MKYIKTYESKYISNNFKYNINDYVLLDIEDIKQTQNPSCPYYKNYGVIMDIPKQEFDDPDPIYDVYIVNNNTYQLSEIPDFYILQSQIKRKLKSKEIEDFDRIITANKFNL